MRFEKAADLHILAIVQHYGTDNPVLGFVVPWLDALASRTRKLTVLSLGVVDPPTRPNMTLLSLGKERGLRFARVGYLWRWHKTMRNLLQVDPPQLVLTHMTPLYSVMTAPYVWRHEIPIVTWFSYPSMKPTLWIRLAECVSQVIASITHNTYPMASEKIVGLGHAIDTNLFSPTVGSENTEDSQHPVLLNVGRLASSKDHRTLIDALRNLRSHGINPRLNILGGSTKQDLEYVSWIKEYVAANGLNHAVEFKGGVRNKDLPEWFRAATLHVDCCHPLDKTHLEALATGCISLAPRNDTFSRIFGDTAEQISFSQGNSLELTQKILNILSMPREQKDILRKKIRDAVILKFGMDAFHDRMTQLFVRILQQKQNFSASQFNALCDL